ncbi:hypothetical protein NL676_003009 [Syzygium grande]|nr:hypothetical protein NL676_003009 [Syzygium grande]
MTVNELQILLLVEGGGFEGVVGLGWLFKLHFSKGHVSSHRPWPRATRLVHKSGDEQLAMGKQRKMKCSSMADLHPTYGLSAVHGHPCALQIYDESPSLFGGTIVDKPPSPADAFVVPANDHRS